MSFGEKDQKSRGQLVLERTSSPPAAPSSPDAAAVDDALADASHSTARALAPHRQPPNDRRTADSPRLQPDHPDDHGERRDTRRRSFVRQHALAFGLAFFVPVAAAGYVYWNNAAHFESSDDAYIATRQFPIAPQVAGAIIAVPVTDNQHVAAGGVIARIDGRAYRIALDQAKAQLGHDQAVLAQAQKNLARYQFLARTKSIAQEQVDDQGYLVKQDEATVALDQANVQTAELNLSHTVVTADQPGRVVNLSAAVGQYAQAGTTLANFVPDQKWVTANFKETQLDAMRPGQPVTLTIDAYPDRVIRGHVASIQPGSGTAFSLLPPENATGNWVKIVQRVPVKIVMDNPPKDVALGPGMSVEASVRVNPNPSLYERLRAWL